MDGERYLQASSTPAIAVSMNVAVGSVVQDEGLNIKAEPADTDLDAGPAASQHVDTHFRRSEAKANFTEEEPGLAELVKSEPALLVKEEVVEDGWQGSKPLTIIYTCDYSKKMFTGKETIRGHIARVHSSGSYKCHQGNKIFKCEAYLMSHKTYMHPAESRLRHTCTNCGQNFSSKWNCQHHEKKGKCACPTAGNTSAAASTSIQQHSVVIVKEEPADGELELGPVVFQHVDCNYRPYKQEPQLD